MLHSGRQEEQCYGLQVPSLHAHTPCSVTTAHARRTQNPEASFHQFEIKATSTIRNWMWPRPHWVSRKRIPLWLAKDGQAVRRTRRTGEARISLAGEAGWEGVCIYGVVCEAVAGRTGFGKVGYLHCWRRIQKEGRRDAAGEASLASTSSGNAPRS